MTEKLYLTASVVASLIGVPRDVVIEDIERGNRGEDCCALAGERQGDWWVVHAYEVEGERLQMHRRRLCPADRENDAHG